MLRNNKLTKSIKQISWLLFILYLIFLAYLVFLSPMFGRTRITLSEYNIIPFHTIKNYIRYRANVNTNTLIINLIGNIVAFMPMGFFVPILFRNSRSVFNVFIFSALVSMIIEITQYKLMVGSLDVDDVILNTFGGVIGYIIFKILYSIYNAIKRSRVKR